MKNVLRLLSTFLLPTFLVVLACQPPVVVEPAGPKAAGPLGITAALPAECPMTFPFDRVEVRLSNGTDSPVSRILSSFPTEEVVFAGLKQGTWQIDITAAKGQEPGWNGRPLVYLSGSTTVQLKGSGPHLSVPLSLTRVLPLTASLPAGTVAQGTQVVFQTPTSDTVIRFTLDGSEPTLSSTAAAPTALSGYQGVTLATTGTWTIKAKGFKTGLTASETLALTFTVIPATQMAVSPTLKQTAGTNQVVVTAATGAQIFLTADGTQPTSSNLFTAGTFTLPDGLTTLKAFAREAGKIDSPVVSQDFSWGTAPVETVAPVFASLPSGTILTTDLISLIAATEGASLFYTVDGTNPLTSVTRVTYLEPFSLSAGPKTLKIAGKKAGFNDSVISTYTYQVNEPTPPDQVALPVIVPLAADILTTDLVTLTTATADASLHYTLDGSNPTATSTLYTKAFTLTAGTKTLKVIGQKNGLLDSVIVAKTFNVTQAPQPNQVEAPVFGNNASVTTAEDIVLTSATAGAEIRYTIGTAVPTATSTLYNPTAKFKLNAGLVTVNAIALKAGMTNSTVTSKTFTVTAPPSGIVLRVYGYTHAHYWNAVPAGSVAATTWPGKAMTPMAGMTGWYELTLAVDSINFVFNNNGAGQTPDQVAIQAGERWFKDGKWYTANPMDAEPPVVKLTAPAAGAQVTGSVTISATASDNNAVARVEFFRDTVSLGSVTAAPYMMSWNSALAPAGAHLIKAVAYDGAGNSSSDAVTVTSSNPNVPPVASAGPDITILAGGTANFDASVSYDPNGTIAAYSWDNGLTGVKASKVYPTIGTYTVTLTVTDNDGATATDTVTVNVVKEISHRDFREETVYFVMTDRFVDGDTTNNNIWGDEYLPGGAGTMYDWSEDKTGILSYYHGGDFKGLIDNLDYIKNMGFTAIWITPVVKQPEGRYFYGGTYQASAFHGYWGYDFDKIDPHLHSLGKADSGWAGMDTLVKAVHAKGMKLMLDIVANHGHPGNGSAPTKWVAENDTVYMAGKKWSMASDPFKDATDKTKGFYNYIGGYDIGGLLDFNERGPAGFDARESLKTVYKKFIDYGVDAFRIDTLAYMTNEWWGEFADAMYNYAKSKGNDYFYMVGEAWCGRYDAIQRVSKDTTKSLHMLDMQASTMDYPGEMQNVFKDGGDYSRFETVTSKDAGFGLEDPTWSGTFVDNHDVYRNNGVYTETQYKNALNYVYLFRGIPIVFYGTEAMYSWSGAHATTNKDDVVARWMLGTEGINHVKNNQPPMYKHIKMLNAVRASSTALQKGVQTNLSLTGDKAVIKRDAGNGKVAFIALNKGAAAYSYTFTGLPNGTYRKVLPDSSAGTFSTASVVVSDGTATVSVPANSFVVLDL